MIEEERMWNCTSCQNENADGAGYCVYCGSRRSVTVENDREIARKFEAAIFPNEKKSSLATNPRFPFRVPVILNLPEGVIRTIGAAGGITLGVACAFAIYILADPLSMTGRLFNLRDPFTIVMVMILIGFFWGLVICFLRFLKSRTATRISHNSLLTDAMELARVEGLNSVVQQLDTPAAQSSPLLSRLHAVSRHWAITPGLQDADLLLQQHLYTGEEEVRAGYSLLRTFIWALPVLGLLGTVAGVAVAVGGFAEFLGGDIEDVAVIKKSLVSVTAGLSYAFLTTLYGLATSLILMLLTTGLQTRDEKLLTRTHQSVTNLFLPLIESVAPQRTPPGESMLPGLQEHLTNVTGTVVGYIREQASESFKSLKEERELLREEILNTVLVRQQAMLQAIAEQNAILDKNAGVLSELNALTRDATQVSEHVNAYLDRLLALELGQRAKDVVHVVESQRKEMEAGRTALTANADITGEVLVAQKALNDSIGKLHEIKFDETLKQVCDSLSDLKPVLENLREPFILQAVPVAKDYLPAAKSPT